MSSFKTQSVFAFGLSSWMIFAIGASQSPPPKPKKPPVAKSGKTGSQFFASSCAPCHGVNGKGGAGFPKPLVGTRTVSELSKFISKTMPPGAIKTPPAEAQKIAEFMHGEFYSPLAQERNRPARVTLSRLTVRQFRNAVADLVGESKPVVPGPSGGLRGEYFAGRDMNGGSRALERTDAGVNFNFDATGPVPGKVDAHNYTARWQGSVYAPDSGDYELIVQTDQATRIYFNGEEKPLIDAWVKSGSDTDYRAHAVLLAGRAYPIQLEFSKATQGVNDDATRKKTPPTPAFVRLMWKRPKGPVEPIPPQYLFPASNGPSYVVDSPFPADDRSIGYERGNTVTKPWDDATTTAALELADHFADRVRAEVGTATVPPAKVEELKANCRKFLERAFRRPLTKEIDQTFIEKQFRVSPNLETAVKRVTLLALKSPRFLYREVGGPSDPYTTASELSFGLWDSIPDAELTRAAASGELSTRAGIQRQAERMANDPRAWTKLRDFLMLWLKVDEIPDIVKSQKRYPGFDDATVNDLRTSLDLFLLSTAGGKNASFREMMLSDQQFLNGRLSKLYGGNLPADAPFQAVKSPDRAGVLTQPYLMARFAYLEGSSPIHRGVLIARNMLGRVLAPPPEAFTPLPASLHPTLTTRARVAMQTKPAMCNSCHSLINPLGFTLERYDAIGRIRNAENGKPIDSTGSYLARNGANVKFTGAADLAKFLADSDETHAAFTEKLFQHLTKQPIRAYGAKTLPNLQASFKKDQYNIRSLMVSIMMASLPAAQKSPQP